MDYVGKICPYCKTPLREDDDVVVCSICEMPHHKDCWIENAACTTFGCTGTMMSPEGESLVDKVTVPCKNCGAPVKIGNKFCTKCGTVVDAHTGPQYTVSGNQYQGQQNMGNYGNSAMAANDPDLKEFLQIEADTYIAKFNKVSEANSFSWNWASFLAGSAWFAFRKMYPLAVVFSAIEIVMGLIPSIGFLLVLCVYAVCGVIGDMQYKKYAAQTLAEAKSFGEAGKHSVFMQKGGTNMGAALAVIGIKFVALIVILG